MSSRLACFPIPWTLRYAKLSCKGKASFHRRTSHGPLHVSEEVQEAVFSKKPVVALETTIYTHGFPYPENIALSSRLESIVRQNGGIPATIGILNGVAKVGFQTEELIELLHSAGSPTTVKVSRRDLGLVCGRTVNGKLLNGGTTIAGTIVLAHLAGIEVFATGGLGGVHRGGENSLDISADLTELGRTPIALISSGCKSFLDIPRTLEYLETQGVSVSTFADGRDGQVDFPAFWTRDSGVASPATVKDEKEAAAVIDAQLSFPLASGMLFANPIPAEHTLEKLKMDKITAEAIQEAHERSMTGSENTPFVLKYLREATKGATVTANIALVDANVRRGTLVAVELATLRRKQQKEFKRKPGMIQQQRAGFSTITYRWYRGEQPQSDLPAAVFRDELRGQTMKSKFLEDEERFASEAMLDSQKSPKVVVAGSVAVDLSCDYKPIDPLPAAIRRDKSQKAQGQKIKSAATLKLATSNPATIRSSIGGVGHNVALAIHHLRLPFCFYSAVGNDAPGKSIIAALEARGIRIDGIQQSKEHRTAQYIAFNNTDKSLFTAVADMTIFDNPITGEEFYATWKPLLWRHRPKWIVIDANWHPIVLEFWTEIAKSSVLMSRLVFEPVSVEKSVRAFPLVTSKNLLRRKPPIDIATPNEYELNAMFGYATSAEYLAAIARATEEHDGSSKNHPSVDDIIAAAYEAAAECLSNAGQHAGPRLGEIQWAAAKAIYLLRYFKTILVKFGSAGILQVSTLFKGDSRLGSSDARTFLVYTKALPVRSHLSVSANGIYLRWHPPAATVPPEEIVSVNGVGDTFLGVLVASLARTEKPIEDLIRVAQRGAVMTLKSTQSVSDRIRHLNVAEVFLKRGRTMAERISLTTGRK